MSALELERLVKEGATTGYSLDNAIGEALGAASVCWDEHGVFQPDRAVEIWLDLRNAILAAITRAVNAQGLDERAGLADWEITELIGQTQAFGFDRDLAAEVEADQ